MQFHGKQHCTQDVIHICASQAIHHFAFQLLY